MPNKTKETTPTPPNIQPAILREGIFTHVGFARPTVNPTSERSKRVRKKLSMVLTLAFKQLALSITR
jgi:hypothetical protein